MYHVLMYPAGEDGSIFFRQRSKRCAWPVTSKCRHNSGWGCRWAMTLILERGTDLSDHLGYLGICVPQDPREREDHQSAILVNSTKWPANLFWPAKRLIVLITLLHCIFCLLGCKHLMQQIECFCLSFFADYSKFFYKPLFVNCAYFIKNNLPILSFE